MNTPFRLRRPLHWLATAGGLGLAPRAPGTFGTLAALPLFALLYVAPLSLYLLVTLAVIVVGVWICGRAAEEAGVHDHPAIVWDEVGGYLVAALPLVTGFGVFSVWVDAALLFVLFRLFDALKPGPIRWLDRRLHGGLGIMADDVAAGAAAAALWYASVALFAPLAG
ncbi:MAG: phosphatidylglycerophosphatase A [Halorhodospira halophila]|uniref:phosphatidylglycerophosphatase A family protein n=1 Tax=Halorhodospira TaxID=85108 RepID=UPI001913B7E8|nr:MULTISPECIES: phosphatidylglycerophosphatase A [Halorhodospira]MBK5935409.1 phosphatidylglycerophosphatase A [Halorhodospira halophila]MBK5943217.1 phosphatidylglycerophosphatase A [Halorhodospira halophila]MCC3751204.1 phosphatidylglycerophosphatase A [Halorhodospira halophila]MCG5526738.1 phosphatidylglycerophosphatase A [Halorhodospira halophila]MCG5533792.1 phosphatidylglycerophosphatase A [Halorhodospira sp. 9621]